MEVEFVKIAIENAKTINELGNVVEMLRPIAANDKSIQTSSLIEEALEKSKIINDIKLTIFLYDLKIRQLYHLNNNLEQVCNLLCEMKFIAKKVNDESCNALIYQLTWHIEKFKGNNKKGSLAINKAIKLVKNSVVDDSYTFYFIKYSYAIEKWLNNHSSESSSILEDCLKYFYEKGYYRSFVQTIAILEIIFTRMQKGNRILEKCKNIFANKLLFEKLPNDVKAISYYFAGLGYMINMKLNFAETYFGKAYDILKPIHKEGIYFSNFIILHSYIITVKALQGKLEQSLKIIQEVESLLKQEFYDKNLDSGTKNQTYHTLNLNKFYVYSRLKNFNPKEMQDLIEEIFKGSKTLYSDFMLLNEFILNSNLKTTQLKELLTTNNFSINRVQHIISFALLGKEEENNTNKQLIDRIEILTNRVKDNKTTFIENVFADLLIVQQLFTLKRYNNIYPLLRKYEKQLNRIEVLELRVFMEAFIQVGIFKIGDPLEPALQYMAIKKCRQYGFSRLENKLLDYLNIQGIDTLRMMA